MSVIIAVLGGFSCNLTGEPIFRFGFLSSNFNCIAWGNQFTTGSSLSEYFFCEKIVPWPLWDPSTYELS